MNIKQSVNGVYHYIIGIAGLSVVILVHELGHFCLAKLIGVEVKIFSIGLGPRLVGYQIGRTIFQLAAIPLGGYVYLNPANLAMQPYSYKMIIVLAGVAFNILFSYFVLVYLTWYDKYPPVPIIDFVIPGSPAQKANLRENDLLLEVDRKPIENMQSFIETIKGLSPGNSLLLTIERDNKRHIVPVTLESKQSTLDAPIVWLGIKLKSTIVKKPGLLHAFREGFGRTKAMLLNIGQFTTNLFTRKNGLGIIGPIGIMNVTAKSFRVSKYYFMFVLAIISVNIAIFNLLPIPFLDGGQALGYTVEFLFGPLPKTIMHYFTVLFLLIFFLFILFVTVRDVRRLRK